MSMILRAGKVKAIYLHIVESINHIKDTNCCPSCGHPVESQGLITAINWLKIYTFYALYTGIHTLSLCQQKSVQFIKSLRNISLVYSTVYIIICLMKSQIEAVDFQFIIN